MKRSVVNKQIKPIMMMMSEIVDGQPKVVEVQEIVDLPDEYIIQKYIIITHDGCIDKVLFDAKHPNCDPKTKEFCMPTYLRGVPVNYNSVALLEDSMKYYQFPLCYFQPTEVTFKKSEGEIIGRIRRSS